MDQEALAVDIQAVHTAELSAQCGGAWLAGLSFSVWYLLIPLCASVPVLRRGVLLLATFFLGILTGSTLGMALVGYPLLFVVVMHGTAFLVLLGLYYWGTKLKHPEYRDN
jgi:hypothetical protein